MTLSIEPGGEKKIGGTLCIRACRRYTGTN
jgi:hypothetical protein